MKTATPQVWHSLPVPSVLIGSDLLIARLNPAAEQFLNQGEKSLKGKRLERVISADVDIAQSLARVQSDHSVLFHRDVNVTPPGRGPILCDLQAAPLNDDDDHILLLLQPRQIAGHLGKALHPKAVAKTAIGIAEMLAHEIKNPLAGISGAAQLLSMHLGAEDRELTSLIVLETQRVVDLLKQVEQFGDLRPPQLKSVNIHDVLERARKSTEVGAAAKMTFRDDYDPSLPSVPADADQLMQVFTNLIANAAEAAGTAGGTITIRTYFEQGLRLHGKTGGHAVPLQVEIIDDGPGVPDSIVESMFEPFISLRENGTGLGLALVSKIVTEHGGTIVAQTRPGRTSFRISLPITPQNGGFA